MKRVLLLAAVVLALGTSSASAAPFTPPFERDYQWAVHVYWHQPLTLCPGGASAVERLVGSPAEMGQVEGGTARPPWYDHCLIEVRSDLPRCLRKVVIVHEVGHLLGYEHSFDPTNIMYGAPSGYNPELCPWQEP